MRDEQHLAALRAYWKAHQAFPAMAKLCEVVGLSSSSSVFALIGRLVEAGYLERVEGRIAPTKRFFARPLIGAVRAGIPQPATDEALDLVTIDDYLVDDPNRSILCRVRGESMREAGLLDGDIVVVERNAPASPGDIVVAVVDGELTVKHLRRANDRYFLQAANPDFADIYPKGSLEILGVVIGSFRRMRR
ncbi:transcriptional repressor LexA [Derxia gummosa]|uniref:Transcriptional repressor LexA n=1 Tax=Derxia gummosa DSM 723 TaxID=1121388 RepID=A0A8B6X6U8_9BURK|nr:transcriptional repressor LexA [Derxia gummosa]